MQWLWLRPAPGLQIYDHSWCAVLARLSAPDALQRISRPISIQMYLVTLSASSSRLVKYIINDCVQLKCCHLCYATTIGFTKCCTNVEMFPAKPPEHKIVEMQDVCWYGVLQGCSGGCR